MYVPFIVIAEFSKWNILAERITIVDIILVHRPRRRQGIYARTTNVSKLSIKQRHVFAFTGEFLAL